MTNEHDGGRRLICNVCSAASPVYDKAHTWTFIRGQLRDKGWLRVTRGADICPSCAKKREAKPSPP